MRSVAGLTVVLTLHVAGALGAASAAEVVTAEAIYEATGIRGGLVVHLGCGDGKLTADLRAGDRYLVHGLDADATRVAEARRLLQSEGLYGPVSADSYDGRHLPYVDNLVNLLVAGDLGQVSMDEVRRVLAPGGVAWILQQGAWQKTVKPRPDEMDEWTHYLHGPDNNAVSRDSLVASPFHLQWVAGPKWARHHNHLSTTSAMVSAGGRIFAIIDEGPAASLSLPPDWQLIARDAFNGVVLWRKPVGPWEGVLRPFRSGPVELSRRLVAVGDRVYVTLGYNQPVVALDAATGEEVGRYADTEGAVEIVCDGRLLYAVVGTIDPEEYSTSRRLGQASPPPRNKRLVAIDTESGEVAWQKSDEETRELMPTTLCAAGGRVYFHNPDDLVCMESGDVAWRASRPLAIDRLSWSAPTLVIHDDVVLSADCAAGPRSRTAEEGVEVEWKVTAGTGSDAMSGGQLVAFSLQDGKELWRCPTAHGYNSPADVLVAGGLVWTGTAPGRNTEDFTEGRDLQTGEVKRRFQTDPLFSVAHHHRCYRDKATDRFLLLGRAGVELIDLADGRLMRNCWVRGGCQYGVMPANGLLYTPPHSCACYIQSKLSGLYALAPRNERDAEEPKPMEADTRLEHGPASPLSEERLPASDDRGTWPTFRHDPARTGRTTATVSASLKHDWQTDLGGRLTSPVIDGGKLLVASVDRHAVHALDAASGQRIWQYTAGGRIDSPPTIAGNVAVFGSADGFVYCLRLADGELVWRFRAAPADRRTVAFGQLESLWPVTGSVLVRDGTVYCTAGRSSFLDGGMTLCRLELSTGRLLGETRFDDRDPKTGMEREETIEDVELPGALPDVLVDDGQYIYLRDKVLDGDGVEQNVHLPHLYCSAGLLDDNWWHRTSWLWGERNWGRASGWSVMPGIRPSGRILVTDQSTVFGYGRKNVQGSNLQGYHLFRADKQVDELDKKINNNNMALSEHQKPAKVTYHWSRSVPLVVRAMALGGETIFAAGPAMAPEDAGANEPSFAAAASVMMAFRAEDGEQLAGIPLDAQPVFDGLALAYGRVFLATIDGRIVCLGER
jgi:outer membrane protein assembly factor BamB